MKQFLKKNILLILSLTLVFALMGSTYAYLAASDNPVTNLFKLAQIDTKITEKTDGDGKKEVTIANKDKSSVYVRARVLVSAGEVGATAVSFEARPAPQPAANAIIVEYNGQDWSYDGDWFYYKAILPGKAEGATELPSTTPVIYQVLVGSDVEANAELGDKFEVEVYQESVLTSAETFNLGNAIAAFGKK